MSSIFPPGREFSINFDWADVNSGTGYILYDCWGSRNNAGNTFHLTPHTYMNTLTGSGYSSETRIRQLDGSVGSDIDTDFDSTPLQRPTSLRGQAIIRLGAYVETNAANTINLRPTIKLRKWDGATETEIASVTGAPIDYTAGGAGGGRVGNWTLVIDVPKTNFKIGEQIRITLSTGFTNVGNGSIAIDSNDLEIAFTHQSLIAGETLFAVALPFELRRD